MSDLSIAILAGGKGTRMGSDKTLARILGRPLLAHVVARLEGLGREIILITNRPDRYADAGFDLPMFGDVWPGQGPLVGIYTALTHAAGVHTLVAAADMPFLDRDLLTYMIGLAPGFDVVVPRLAAGPEGLHAVYSKACLEPIRARLEVGQRKVINFYDDVRTCYVEAAEINRFDPDHRSFFNVNTPADLEAARRIAARDGL